MRQTLDFVKYQSSTSETCGVSKVTMSHILFYINDFGIVYDNIKIVLFLQYV